MSDEYDGINGFTTGGIVFLFSILFLAFMCSIGDKIEILYGSPAADAWMVFLILGSLCISIIDN